MHFFHMYLWNASLLVTSIDEFTVTELDNYMLYGNGLSGNYRNVCVKWGL